MVTIVLQGSAKESMIALAFRDVIHDYTVTLEVTAHPAPSRLAGRQAGTLTSGTNTCPVAATVPFPSQDTLGFHICLHASC